MESLSSAFARTAQRAKALVGVAEETIDANLNADVEKFRRFYKRMKGINEHSKKCLDLLRELSAAQAALMEEFKDMHDSTDEMYAVCCQTQQAFKELEVARNEMEETWKDDFNAPVSAYLGQYQEIEKRLAVREKRRLDMDRHRSHLKSVEAKAKPGDPKEKEAKERFAVAQEGYLQLHRELSSDIPALCEDRKACLKPILATLIDSFVLFYARNNTSFVNLQRLCVNVDRTATHTRGRVITAPEVSAAYREPTLASINYEHVAAKPVDHGPVQAAPVAASSAYEAPVVAHAASTSNVAVAATPATAAPAARGSGVGVKPVPKPSAASPKAKAPPQTATPGPVYPKAKALFPFTGQDATELNLQPGDIINVCKQDGDWWEGELRGRVGLFPANYTALL